MSERVTDARLRELAAARPDRMGGTLIDTLLLRELAAEILAARTPDDAAERAARGQAWALAEAQGEVAMLRAQVATLTAERDRYREVALTSDSDAENAAEAAADGVLAIGAALGREGATAGECVALIEGLRAQVARGDLAGLAAREQGEGATFRAWRRGEITTAERDVALRSEGR